MSNSHYTTTVESAGPPRRRASHAVDRFRTPPRWQANGTPGGGAGVHGGASSSHAKTRGMLRWTKLRGAKAMAATMARGVRGAVVAETSRAQRQPTREGAGVRTPGVARIAAVALAQCG